MPIVSSSYVIDAHTQSDGSRYCRERHVLDDGRVVKSIYRLAGKTDPDEMLAKRAAAIEQDMADAEQARAEVDAVNAKHEAIVSSAIDTGVLTKEEAEKLGVKVPEKDVKGGPLNG